MRTRSIFLLSSTLLFACTVSQASLITPIGATSSSALGDRPVTNLFNQVEMNFIGVPGQEGDYTQYTMSPANDNLSRGEGWMASVDPDAWAILDLGGVERVDTISIWNFNPASPTTYLGRSVKDLEVYIRSDADTSNLNGVNAPFNATGWTSLGSLSLSQNPSNTTVLSPNGLLTNLDTNGRYLAFEVQSTHNAGDAIYPGIGEIQVFVIPEPTTSLALSLLFTGLACTRRRRRLPSAN